MTADPDAAGTVRVGILQFIPQLEDALWGFMGSLEANLGRRPSFEILEASGREQRCPALARKLVDRGCDLLFGGLTPAAAALAEAAYEKGIPVVFAPVFHPVLLGLLEDEDRPGGHVTGVTGRLRPGEKAEKAALLFPDLEAVTVIANGKDPLSCWEAGGLAGAFRDRGVRAAVHEDRSGRPGPIEEGGVHLLAFSPDLEETLDAWIEPFFDARAPLIGSGARAGFQGAVLSVFADHGVCGRIAGEMAAEILKGRSPAALPVRHPPGARIGINYYAAGRLGIRVPPRLGQEADIL